ncbi:MAG TPA: MoaD/ThiS family protein [bacterium]|nr:MoaD/ThiS family protein [bacterium]
MPPIKVTVKLFASLQAGRFKIQDLVFEAGTTVAELIASLDIPEKEVSLIMINGRHKELDHRLAEAETCALFPPVGGG